MNVVDKFGLTKMAPPIFISLRPGPFPARAGRGGAGVFIMVLDGDDA